MAEERFKLQYIHFNSIKVQLKHCLTSCDKGSELVFQFHKGTIKACDSTLSAIQKCLFQFHKGTIKAQILSQHFVRICDISIP